MYLALSLLGALICLVFASSETVAQSAAADPSISYEVDLDDAKNHYLTITAEFPADKKSTELMMAVWTPGSYLVREYARHVDSMEVTSGGKPLAFEKTRKNRWQVQTDGVDRFQVKYRLYCNEMSVRTNWVGKQYAVINGAPTFLTIPNRLDQQHLVKLKLPQGWTRSATSLNQTGDTPHSFVAKDFDELVDSPIVAGNINVYPFTAGGVEHQLVNVGESGYWDGTKAATDLKRIVESHQKMWNAVPYDRYLFLNVIAESGGGLEHDNSCLIMTSRWSFRDERRYQSWLSLASHEFFHTWNVRRLRPQPLVNYDYENEVYTDGLWIAEGVTSYYEDLALVRAGLTSRNDFLGQLSRNVEGVQRTEGRKVQSLKDSSFDTWIKFYRPDENASNTRISYYSKGAVAAFLLDARIRKLTNGKKSLDDVMRKMFKTYSQSGFTRDEFRKTASDVAGSDLSKWFALAIDSTDELDYSDIETLGIVVPNAPPQPTSEKPETSQDEDTAASKKKSSKQDSGEEAAAKQPEQEDEKAPSKKRGKRKKKTSQKPDSDSKSEKSEADSKPEAKPAPKPKPWLGISTSDSDGKVTISSVKPDSPGFDVGLNVGDEVIAINGFRITRSVDSRLAQYEVGEEIELLIARLGKLITIRVEIGELETKNWRLRFVAKPSDAQKAQLDNWLATPEDSKPKDK
jgi:predicted metalloprotease with PDZ domain